jgi:hypothetical protein
MAAEGHNGGSSPSENPTRVEHSLDELARGLADGTISRGKAIRWMGGALVGAALASVPGVAWASNRCGSQQTRCNGRCVNLQQNERYCGSCSNSCAEGEECVEGVCSGGVPICTPSCPTPPCFCMTRADGIGTVCTDCGTQSCSSPPNNSCAECRAGTICVSVGQGNVRCDNPCLA